MKCLYPLAALLLIQGCAPAQEPPNIFLPPETVPDTIVDDTLIKREPDSCGAADFADMIGQPEGMLRTVVLTGPYRVVPFGTLVTQEYNAQRVDFYLDETGIITKITCG